MRSSSLVGGFAFAISSIEIQLCVLCVQMKINCDTVVVGDDELHYELSRVIQFRINISRNHKHQQYLTQTHTHSHSASPTGEPPHNKYITSCQRNVCRIHRTIALPVHTRIFYARITYILCVSHERAYEHNSPVALSTHTHHTRAHTRRDD